MQEALEQIEGLLKDRLGELTDESKRLERALQALDGGSQASKGSRRGPGRPPKVAKSPGRPTSKGGTRAMKALELIEAKPGITASEVAKTMKIKPNYLYRVLGDLAEKGHVKKDGRQYFPAPPPTGPSGSE